VGERFGIVLVVIGLILAVHPADALEAIPFGPVSLGTTGCPSRHEKPASTSHRGPPAATRGALHTRSG
jgi:hypothetical protein